MRRHGRDYCVNASAQASRRSRQLVLDNSIPSHELRRDENEKQIENQRQNENLWNLHHYHPDPPGIRLELSLIQLLRSSSCSDQKMEIHLQYLIRQMLFPPGRGARREQARRRKPTSQLET